MRSRVIAGGAVVVVAAAIGAGLVLMLTCLRMAPIVYGIEEEFDGSVDFVSLDVSQHEVRPISSEFGFEATPHFFVRTAEGEVVWSRQGEVSDAELRRELESVLQVDSASNS